MVFVSEAVIDENTVVVKLLNAAVTVIAVPRVFWHQRLARHTHVIQVVIFSY